MLARKCRWYMRQQGPCEDIPVETGGKLVVSQYNFVRAQKKCVCSGGQVFLASSPAHTGLWKSGNLGLQCAGPAAAPGDSLLINNCIVFYLFKSHVALEHNPISFCHSTFATKHNCTWSQAAWERQFRTMMILGRCLNSSIFSEALLSWLLNIN